MPGSTQSVTAQLASAAVVSQLSNTDQEEMAKKEKELVKTVELAKRQLLAPYLQEHHADMVEKRLKRDVDVSERLLVKLGVDKDDPTMRPRFTGVSSSPIGVGLGGGSILALTVSDGSVLLYEVGLCPLENVSSWFARGNIARSLIDHGRMGHKIYEGWEPIGKTTSELVSTPLLAQVRKQPEFSYPCASFCPTPIYHYLEAPEVDVKSNRVCAAHRGSGGFSAQSVALLATAHGRILSIWKCGMIHWKEPKMLQALLACPDGEIITCLATSSFEMQPPKDGQATSNGLLQVVAGRSDGAVLCWRFWINPCTSEFKCKLNAIQSFHPVCDRPVTTVTIIPTPGTGAARMRIHAVATYGSDVVYCDPNVNEESGQLQKIDIQGTGHSERVSAVIVETHGGLSNEVVPVVVSCDIVGKMVLWRISKKTSTMVGEPFDIRHPSTIAKALPSPCFGIAVSSNSNIIAFAECMRPATLTVKSCSTCPWRPSIVALMWQLSDMLAGHRIVKSYPVLSLWDVRHALRNRKLSFKIGIEQMPALPKELRYLLVVLGRNSYENHIPQGETQITGPTDDMDEYCVKAIGRIESVLKEFKSALEPSIRTFPVIVANALSALHRDLQASADAEASSYFDDQADLMTYWSAIFECGMYKCDDQHSDDASSSAENQSPGKSAGGQDVSSKIDFEDPIYKRIKACYDVRFDPENEACHQKCPACQSKTKPNVSFSQWTCESGHVLPGCTLSLQPIWNAAGRMCVFCGRHRIYQGPFAARLCPPAFCNWCGHVVKPPLASEWHAKSRPPAPKAKAKAAAAN